MTSMATPKLKNRALGVMKFALWVDPYIVPITKTLASTVMKFTVVLEKMLTEEEQRTTTTDTNPHQQVICVTQKIKKLM